MITLADSQFIDEYGRSLLWRGVNLGGSSKVPTTPNGATHLSTDFYGQQAVSFVGRPFPLAEADAHFARLRAWGFNFLRFLITWEAIEHAGPGIYDQDYLDYVEAVVRKAGEYGFTLFIDPHQDVWSRFSGGDGAPEWTFTVLGMNPAAFPATGAAIVHQVHGDPFPRMIWPTNGTKLAAATLFTLFFAGDDFAPQTQIAGESAQQFLQRHYIDAIAQVAGRLKDCAHVIGFDTMNEPLHGFIGHRDLRQLEGFLKVGATPTPYQGMLLGSGYPQEVANYAVGLSGIKQAGQEWINQSGVSLWRDGNACIWRQNGVWDVDPNGAPMLLRPDHFADVNGHAVDFSQDYYRPFAQRFARAIRSARPNTLLFIQSEVGFQPPMLDADAATGVVYAPHWYDGLTLILKRYTALLGYDTVRERLVVGPRAIRASFAAQLQHFRTQAQERLHNAPVVIGEIGIPFDLNDRVAYRRGNVAPQVGAVDRSMVALEDTLLSVTWWNYTADNDLAHGDQWNDEDLSIFSREQQRAAGAKPDDQYAGGRALSALIRPYARATAGTPLRMQFDRRRRVFTFVFRHDPRVTAPTEIFVPTYHYPHGCRVSVSDGTYELDRAAQVLRYSHTPGQAEHTITLRP